jgi:RHS repeat-associated protein
VDARANRTTFVLDDAARLTRRTDPLGRSTTFGYDSANRQVLRLDARGIRTTYVYDDADRLTAQRYSDGSRATIAYSVVGDRTLLSDPTGRKTYTYDDARRLRNSINPAGKRISYAYDGLGQRTLLVEPGSGRFTYTYDAAGEMTRLLNPDGQPTTWAYDDAGQRASARLANGTRASYTYDAAGQTTRLANLNPSGTTLSSFNYALDAAGNRTRVVEVSGDCVTWIYDNLYRLVSEQRSGTTAYTITYSYDPTANRLTKSDGGVPTTYSYDNAGQLLLARDATGTTTFAYDVSGNQIRQVAPNGGRTTWIWDAENRLTGVTLPSGTRNTFSYDADGKRVQKQDSSGTVKFLWDWENILLETDATDVTQALYTIKPEYYGSVISQRRAGITRFLQFDGLGSTRQVTDGLAGVTDTYLYDAFGTIRVGTGSTIQPHRFIGRSGYYYDSDLVQYSVRARHYVPSLGRFLSIDPLANAVATVIPQAGFGIDFYVYVADNPVMYIDPSGLQFRPDPQTLEQIGELITAVAVGGAAAKPAAGALLASLPALGPVGWLLIGGAALLVTCLTAGYAVCGGPYAKCLLQARRDSRTCASKACPCGFPSAGARSQCAARYGLEFLADCQWSFVLCSLQCGLGSFVRPFNSCLPNRCTKLCSKEEYCWCDCPPHVVWMKRSTCEWADNCKGCFGSGFAPPSKPTKPGTGDPTPRP